jgi:hypothetical protein
MTHLRPWTVAAAALALIAVTAACGDDDDDDGADPRVGQVGAVSENATYAWAQDGAAGLYDYLASSVTDVCTAEQVEIALAGHDEPTDWQQVNDVEFPADDSATATVNLIYGSERREEQWSFVQDGESWRISNVPGLEDCEAAS